MKNMEKNSLKLFVNDTPGSVKIVCDVRKSQSSFFFSKLWWGGFDITPLWKQIKTNKMYVWKTNWKNLLKFNSSFT
jgi:hypothetical protein